MRSTAQFGAIALTAALAAAACGSDSDSGGDSTTEVYEFNYAQYGAPSNAQTLNSIEFADAVRERTNGQIDITVRPAGELPYAPSEYLQRAGDGSVDMAEALGGFISGDCPVATVSAFPFLVEDAEAHQAMWPVVEPYVQECMQSMGVRMMWSFGFPTVQIFGSGDAPETLEDLKGLSVRQLGPESTEWLQELGVEPVTLTTDEVASAMQRGVIDGFITSADTTNTIWAELADWVFVLNLGVTPQYAMMNQGVYDELPDDLRATLDETAEEWLANSTAFFAERDDEAMASLEQEHGYTIVIPTDADRERAREIAVDKWDDWAENLAGADGLSALEDIRDALGQ